MVFRYEDVCLQSSRDLRTSTIQGERDELVMLADPARLLKGNCICAAWPHGDAFQSHVDQS